MGNKTRKDGAFKGEGTSLRGEERKERGKKRRIREGVGEPHLAIPFVSVLPESLSSRRGDALLRRPTMRLHRYKRDI